MECSLPLKIGSNIMIKNYNTFLENHGSAGYKFWFDKKTSDVFIIGMASTRHEGVITQLQDYFKIPNNGVVVNPPIRVYGRPRKRIYSSLLLVIKFSIILSFFSYSSQWAWWNRAWNSSWCCCIPKYCLCSKTFRFPRDTCSSQWFWCMLSLMCIIVFCYICDFHYYGLCREILMHG